MIARLKDHINTELPFLKKGKLLLAVSGGLDSMVLAYFCQRLKLNFGIAHCNFQLRGDESREDYEFVKSYAAKKHILFFEETFNTIDYATENKLSLQVAARELRYNWFNTILEKEGYDYVLTAHHADDALETFFINLVRGSGIDGLVGIPLINEKVVRPLLIFSRDEILNFAQKENCAWREDSSNLSDKYLRNKIRHHIVPFFKNLNSSFLDSFQDTQEMLKESQQMMMDAVDYQYKLVSHTEEDAIFFDVNKLKRLKSLKGYLYYWLKTYKFTSWDDIYDLVNAQTGKIIYSKTHQLLKNRDFLILSPNNQLDESSSYSIGSFDEEVNFPIKLSICQVADIPNDDNNTIFVDGESLMFPLTIRHWEEGDVFQPIGMEGSSKKISKFFKDEKFSQLEKDATWLLCSENQIVWVIGSRMDERFKVSATTTDIIQIKYLK